MRATQKSLENSFLRGAAKVRNFWVGGGIKGDEDVRYRRSTSCHWQFTKLNLFFVSQLLAAVIHNPKSSTRIIAHINKNKHRDTVFKREMLLVFIEVGFGSLRILQLSLRLGVA